MNLIIENSIINSDFESLFYYLNTKKYLNLSDLGNFAAKNNKLDVLEFLYNNSDNFADYAAYIFAASNKNYEILNFLKDHSIPGEVNAYYEAEKTNDQEMLNFLHNNGFYHNYNRRLPCKILKIPYKPVEKKVEPVEKKVEPVEKKVEETILYWNNYPISNSNPYYHPSKSTYYDYSKYDYSDYYYDNGIKWVFNKDTSEYEDV